MKPDLVVIQQKEFRVGNVTEILKMDLSLNESSFFVCPNIQLKLQQQSNR